MLVSNLISQDIFNVEKEALDYRYEYFRKTALTDDELKGGKFSIGGISVITTDKDVLGIPRRKSTVFIAVRNMPNRRIFTSGNERLEVPTNQIFYSRIFGAPLAPAPDQSEPILGNFTVGDDPDYPLEASLPGTTLRHELQHVKGLNHPDTDLEVITDLREARQKFENGDDSGYWLEFRTPAGSTIT